MRSAAIACLLTLTAIAAEAREYNATARAGQPVQVLTQTSVDRMCQPTGGPSISVDPEPSHGSVTIRPASSVIETCGAGACQCRGHRVASVAVVYTSNPAFHGVDHFGVTSTFANGTVLNHSATVNVR